MCFSLIIQNSDLSTIAKYRPLNSHVQFYLKKEDWHCGIYIAVFYLCAFNRLKNNARKVEDELANDYTCSV